MADKIIVKFNFPKHWNTYTPGLSANFKSQSPGSNGKWNEFTFEINNSVKECDYWVVMGDLDDTEKAIVEKKTIFITSEEAQKRWDNKFLNQFDIVITSQAGVGHSYVLRDQYLCPWQVQKSYDELVSINHLKKTKDLSAIISDITWLEGHKKRYALINKLKGHFKNKLDWYGRGNLFLENKWDGLGPYKYSIAIENTSVPYYWTEKLADCFLSLTMPFYFGCTNILEYFPEGSLILLDVDDFEKSIHIIEEAISDNLYEKNYQALLKAKDLVLNNYQFFPKITSILSHIETECLSKSRVVNISPESKFGNKSILKRSFAFVKRQLANNE